MYIVYDVYRDRFLKIFDVIDVKGFDKVLLKPNICGLYPPNMDLLKSLLKYLVGNVGQVLIGETDSTLYRVEDRFQRLGLIDLVKIFNDKVVLKNLLLDEKIEVNIPNPRAVKKIPLPKTIFEVDYFINMARIGSHPSTKITAALKNLFGLVAVRNKYFRYHPRGMDKVVSDIAKIVNPDLNIVEVDDRVLVSKDVLAVDIVASKMFGVDPFKVKHLIYVAEDRGTELKEVLNKIKVIGV